MHGEEIIPQKINWKLFRRIAARKLICNHSNLWQTIFEIGDISQKSMTRRNIIFSN